MVRGRTKGAADRTKRKTPTRQSPGQYKKKYTVVNRGPRGPYNKTKDVKPPMTPEDVKPPEIPDDIQEALDYLFEFDNLDHLTFNDFEFNFEIDFEKEIEFL